MANINLPATMRAWQYSSAKGGIEKHMKLNPSAPLPQPKPEEHLVKVIAACLNPVDYKPAELPLVGRALVSKPATPGIDFAGTIVKAAQGSPLTPGQLVFGIAGSSPFSGGALREYATANAKTVAVAPPGLSAIDASTIGVAALTAYQSTVPHIKKGDKVFVNGGSGGCGSYCIQYAKLIGCHVVTTCSTANVQLCKSLGADEVVDYKQGDVSTALIRSGHKFSHAVDNVGTDSALIWASHKFMAPGATYVVVGGGLESLRGAKDSMLRKTLPRFLGGLQNKVTGFWPKANEKDLSAIGEWMKNGDVKPLIDERFPFERATEAMVKLKTGRARGKILIEVASVEEVTTAET